jgi:hypothetical protein
VAQPERTEPLAVCVDADVLIAGLLSRSGANHAILVLGELGLLRLVLPEFAVAEVRRNLGAKLPEVLPLFEEFLRSALPSRSRSTVRHRTTVNERANSPTRRMCRFSPRPSAQGRPFS